jgi:hypothetical protein
MSKIFKSNYIIIPTFLILFSFYFFIFSSLKKINVNLNKDYEFTYIYQLGEYGVDSIYNENQGNYINVFASTPSVYFDLFMQNFTKQFNNNNINTLVEYINSKLPEKNKLDLSQDHIHLKVNSSGNIVHDGQTLSVIINSDRNIFDKFNDNLFNFIIEQTNINYINILKKYYLEQSSLFKSYEIVLDDGLKRYVGYLNQVTEDDYNEHGRYFFENLYKFTYQKDYQRVIRKTPYNLDKRELILFIENIISSKSYEAVASDYITRKTDLHNLNLMINRNNDLLNKNLPIKEEIQDFITMDKYETKNKILIFHNHQKIIVTFIFTVLSYIILINIYINRNRFWKILKRI